jgi:hypothetical protein
MHSEARIFVKSYEIKTFSALALAKSVASCSLFCRSDAVSPCTSGVQSIFWGLFIYLFNSFFISSFIYVFLAQVRASGLTMGV